jgi:integrase
LPKVATQLKPASRGGFVARKWLPVDVREAYGKLYGDGEPQWEAWFNSGDVKLSDARARHRDWLNEVETRIANIRAERKGEGRKLTPKEARALAGEWYTWFTAKMAARNWPTDGWEEYEFHMRSELYGPAMAGGVYSGDPLDFWRRDEGMRERVRPMIADEAKSHQFLAAKRLILDQASLKMFLDCVTQDFFAALNLLVRRADGDFGEDKYAKRFPRQGEGLADPDLTAWALFEKWIAEAKPALSTVDRWRAVFLKLQADFPNTNAAALLPEQMQSWAEGLITKERSPVTVRDVWVIACRTVFAWGIGKKLISRNPFTGWRVTVPKKVSTRETKAFTEDEISTILKAALKIKVCSKTDAAKRWCPWLAAYTGARMGELTQLRGSDVFEQEGIWAIKISPEAGTVKNRKPRTVPLHQHLIKQGFVRFVKVSGKGPLFYNEAYGTAEDDPTNPKRPRAVKARERVAAWVRKIGVDDPELQPNHAWRHTFKKRGDRAGLSEKMLDVICGHAPATVGRGYGEADLSDKAEALRRFPRFKFEARN